MNIKNSDRTPPRRFHIPNCRISSTLLSRFRKPTTNTTNTIPRGTTIKRDDALQRMQVLAPPEPSPILQHRCKSRPNRRNVKLDRWIPMEGQPSKDDGNTSKSYLFVCVRVWNTIIISYYNILFCILSTSIHHSSIVGFANHVPFDDARGTFHKFWFLVVPSFIVVHGNNSCGCILFLL